MKNALHCATISVQSSGAQKSYARLMSIPEEFQPPAYSDAKYDKYDILSSL